MVIENEKNQRKSENENREVIGKVKQKEEIEDKRKVKRNHF
jgi:hypothetical protein